MPTQRFALPLTAALLGAACAESPVSPRGEPQTPLLSIAPAEITLQVLPVPSGWSGQAKAVAGDGTIFATNYQNGTPGPLFTWGAPYATLPTLTATLGATWPGAANALGDAAGFTPAASGAFLQGPAGTWTFVASPEGGYLDLAIRVINDQRELGGFVLTQGSNGANPWAAAFFPAPGAAAVELPAPSSGSLTGSRAMALNNLGDIAGEATEVVGSGKKQSTRRFAVTWQRTGPASWDVVRLPITSTSAPSNGNSINDAGQIAGSDGAGLVRWTPNGSGGWQVTRINGVGFGGIPQIDGCGRVAGYAPIGSTRNRAFVWDGSLTVLPLPSGAVETGANGFTTDVLSGRGVIVGWALNNGGQAKPYPVRWTIPSCP